VESASPNYEVRALAVPNDPKWSELWGMAKIRADQAWDTTTGSTDVYVAVIDTGIDAAHEDLAANVDRNLSRSFVNPNLNDHEPVENSNYADGDGHGTHVAGTIAAVGNNGVGVVGVNWTARVIALKVLSDNGSGHNSWITAAIDYIIGLLQADPDMKIASVNLSLGGWEPQTPKEAQLYNV